ncbi:unnamed protein product [Lactuca saligna]|uniref:UBC core domain-containing protein n=1 Tax=Lactuca saligna TaxID=75948 RepID=A0AA36E3L2_LACSI|nr:unnamed protein product [Lactuca saligna]
MVVDHGGMIGLGLLVLTKGRSGGQRWRKRWTSRASIASLVETGGGALLVCDVAGVREEHLTSRGNINWEKPYFEKVDLLSASFRVDSLTICFDKNPLPEIPNIFLSSSLLSFYSAFDPTGIMIKLFKVKEKQRELAENSNGKPPVKKQSAGELRLHKDISELNLPKTCSISFPNGKDDLMNFEVTIRPDDGYYLGGTFTFTFQISSIYPHEAPKVKCKTKVYHPNIDLDGNVCLNILREDWKPVLNINTIIYGLYHLFTEPNHEDPLNREAAAVLRDNPKMFESNVRRAMAGGYVGQTFFTRCI